MVQENFRGLVFTNHALLRLKDRKLGKRLVFNAFKVPDQKIRGKNGTIKCQKEAGGRQTTVVVKKSDDGKWLAISCWIDPPLKGSLDDKKRQRYLKYKKAGFWGQFWLEIKRGFGIN